MKRKLIILILLLCLFLILFINFEKSHEKQTVTSPIEESESLGLYKTFTYVITDINGNEYFGQSVDGKTKIHFNLENVKQPITEQINVNDKILAYVETENHVNGILKIEKLDK
jgi:hypothetical protein